MLDTLHVLERKQDPMEEIFGEFSEYINLKRLSNSFILLQINHGRSLTR